MSGLLNKRQLIVMSLVFLFIITPLWYSYSFYETSNVGEGIVGLSLSKSKLSEADISFHIVASMASLKIIVNEIVGNLSISVDYIIPDGVDPHSYSLTTNDVSKLSSADLLVLADTEHLTIESNMRSYASSAVVLDFVNYTKYGAVMLSIPGLEHNFHGYWIYPNNALAIAKAIAIELSTALPQYSSVFELNYNMFEKRINSINNEYQSISNQYALNNTGVVIAVPGAAYFAAILGFNICATIVKGPNRFINVTELSEIEKDIRDGIIKYVILPVSLTEAKPGEISNQLSRDTGVTIIYVKLFLIGTFNTYSNFMSYNIGYIESQVAHGGSTVSVSSVNTFLYYFIIGLLTFISIAEGLIIFKYRRIVEEAV